MLLKLLKYDLRAMWKKLSLIWGAVLVLGLVNRYTNSLHFIIFVDPSGTVNGFTIFALTAVLVAMVVIAIIFVVQRFYKGLLGNEGYLMHTLPVHAWQLVLSKLICALITYVGSGVAALLAIFLMIPTDWLELMDISLWSELIRALTEHPDTITLFLDLCLLLFSDVLQSIATLYLAMSIGHLFARHRVLASVVSFLGLYILVNNVYSQLFSWDPAQIFIDATTESIHGTMLAVSAAALLPAVIFLAAVCWILENKLNLE